MYLLTAEEMRKLDHAAINQLGIPGIVLMENAGLKIVQEVFNLIGNPKGKTVTIFAGRGNNGGDGFVVARHLLNAGAEVKVFLLAEPEEMTGDAKTNMEILIAMGHKVFPIIKPNSLNIVRLAMVYADVVIDAIFGTGFRGMIPTNIGNVIEIINTSEKPVISVDIPSGLEADTGRVNGPCIKAASTITFGQNKLGLIIGAGPEYVGKLSVVDISIPDSLVKGQQIKRYLVTNEIVKALLPERKADSHKGTYGRVLVVGGSRGLTGAAAMTSMAALTAGAGLVTAAVPTSLHDLMEVKLTEVMTKPLPETDDISISLDALEDITELTGQADVLALGPGMSTNGDTMELVRQVLLSVETPVVVDADGLNALAGSTDILNKSKAPLVLTPHPGEMSRLLGIKTEEVQNNRVEITIESAKKWNAVVVLKGDRSVIADPDGSLYINPTGNPGMASGGTGDILTGMIAAFIGQGLTPIKAAVTGVYFHGLAGDLAAEKKSMLSLVAGDLLEYMPEATRGY